MTLSRIIWSCLVIFQLLIVNSVPINKVDMEFTKSNNPVTEFGSLFSTESSTQVEDVKHLVANNSKLTSSMLTFENLFSKGNLDLVLTATEPPTFQPTEMPTEKPSEEPTESPTEEPSLEPSKEASEEPTEEPTSVPTSFNCYLDVNASFILVNVTSKKLKSGLEALIDTISEISEVSTNDINFVDVLSRTKTFDDVGKANDLWTFEVLFNFFVPLTEFPNLGGNSNKVFNKISSDLAQAIAEPSDQAGVSVFDKLLRENALVSGSMTLVTTESVQFDSENRRLNCNIAKPTGQPSSQPTTQPTSSPTESTSDDYFTFNAYIGMSKISTSSLSNAGQTALVETVSDVLDISVSDVQFIASTDYLNECNGYYKQVAQVKVTIYLSSFPEFNGNATKSYLYVTALLKESTNDNTFQNLLRNKAGTQGALELNQVFAWKVEYTAWTLDRNNVPSCVPVSEPTASPPTVSPPSATPPTADPPSATPPTADPPSAGPPSAGPPSAGPPSAGPPSAGLPSAGPPSAGPPSAGPPSAGPPSAGPPSAGPPSAGPPTSEVTVSPTATPTFAPTDRTTDLIQFKIIFWISALKSQLYGSFDQEALLRAIAAVLAEKYENVEFLAIRNILSRRRLSDPHELVLATRVTLNTVDYPEFNDNATALYINVTNSIRQNVSSGAMTTIYQSNAVTVGAVNSTEGIIEQVTFEDFLVIGATPSSVGKAPLNLSTSDLAAIIGGAVVGLGLLLFLAYIGYSRYYKNQSEKEIEQEKLGPTTVLDSSFFGPAGMHSASEEMSFDSIYDLNGDPHNPDMVIINIHDYDDVSGTSERNFLQQLPVVPLDSATFESRI